MPEAVADASLIAGRYRVVRVLGRGAFATTSLCERLDDGKPVAIKELHVERTDDWKAIELFHREAKVLSALRHPAIPEIHEHFEAEGTSGRRGLFLVQECIEGESLAHRLEHGPLLGENDLFAIALGIVDVLEYLHGRVPPVYHRDIKPSNIVVRPNGEPALVDFGGVCFGWRPAGLTGTSVIGTFGYMPPEQLLGQVGPTADYYALAATLLHALTGRPPHEFPFDTGRIEVPHDLPGRPGLRRFVDAALSIAPRDRPRTAEAARRLLADDAAARGVALVQVSKGRLMPTDDAPPVTGPDAPRWIDVGEPPRDPEGPFRDVYRHLVDPHNPFRDVRGLVGRIVSKTVYLIVCTVSFGVVPFIHLTDRHQRKRNYARLFREGLATDGTIIDVFTSINSAYTSFKYEYEVGGRRYRGAMPYPQAYNRFWSPGDRVRVLFDRDRPEHSCFVFRVGE